MNCLQHLGRTHRIGVTERDGRRALQAGRPGLPHPPPAAARLARVFFTTVRLASTARRRRAQFGGLGHGQAAVVDQEVDIRVP